MLKKHSETPTLITGCARSGTSLIAGIVHLCGAFGGDLLGPITWNQKGMFENLYIRENMVKPYLGAIMADPKGQRPLPIAETVPVIQDWDEFFLKVMVEQGYKEGPIFYKGAKMCLMWPVWKAAFPNAKWIIVRRDNKGIIKSCLRTPFMNAYNNEEGWQEWINHHILCWDEMHNAELDILEVWTPPLIDGDLSGAKEMIQWLGLEWDEEKVDEFVTPEIWGQS